MTNPKTGGNSSSGKLPIESSSTTESKTAGKAFRDPRTGAFLGPTGAPKVRKPLISKADRTDSKRSENSVRAAVELPQEQILALAAIGKREHLPRAELVRRAVAEFIDRQSPPPQDAAFGLWHSRQRDGLSYQEGLRAEWDA